MKTMFQFKSIWLGLFTLVLGLFTADLVSAQTSQTVQLPTVRFFNARTVVSVPDGGTTRLGGVNRYSAGSIDRGIPGFSGRPFRNRGISRNVGASNSSVSAKIIVMSEYEKAVMAEAARRRAIYAAKDPNGSVSTQKKADFISQNIGRRRSR